MDEKDTIKLGVLFVYCHKKKLRKKLMLAAKYDQYSCVFGAGLHNVEIEDSKIHKNIGKRVTYGDYSADNDHYVTDNDQIKIPASKTESGHAEIISW